MDKNKAKILLAILFILLGIGLVVFNSEKNYSLQDVISKNSKECVENSDCVLVQGERCKVISAVDKDLEDEWYQQDEKNTERGRQERWTCEPRAARSPPSPLQPSSANPMTSSEALANFTPARGLLAIRVVA